MQVSRRLFNGFLAALPFLRKYDFSGNITGESLTITRDMTVAPHTVFDGCRFDFVGGRLVIPDIQFGTTIRNSYIDAHNKPWVVCASGKRAYGFFGEQINAR